MSLVSLSVVGYDKNRYIILISKQSLQNSSFYVIFKFDAQLNHIIISKTCLRILRLKQRPLDVLRRADPRVKIKLDAAAAPHRCRRRGQRQPVPTVEDHGRGRVEGLAEGGLFIGRRDIRIVFY